MDSRERIQHIFAREPADRCGFWLGNPHADTWPIYFRHFGIRGAGSGTRVARDGVSHPQRDSTAEESLRRLLGDDLRWICPQWVSYKHPQGRPLWNNRHDASSGLASGGVFADCEDPAEVDRIEWPDPDHLDFTESLRVLRSTGPYYRLGGFWCCFFHDVADFFGMENYFVKMHTHPEVVEAVTRRVCAFYLEANERFFAQAGGELDGVFFGNDFGTQLDLLVSPACFDRFVMPWFRKFTEQGHAHGYQVVLHSCGAVAKVIDRLIEAGVDALHPLQSKAAGMDATMLAQRFKGRIAFLGGIDTQHLLVHGTPAEVRAEVARVRGVLGPHLVVSPSHEALLPNVPPANVEAMARTATGAECD